MDKYYLNIKNNLLNNETYKKVKDYSKNRNDLETYYNVGKLLNEAGKHYGESIIKKYSIKLTNELNRKYSLTNLKYMKQFYLLIEKGHALRDQLTWTHYRTLLSIKNKDEINYYIKITIKECLSYRQLKNRIKNKEYERLGNKAKVKFENSDDQINNFVKNPILIHNKYNTNEISEKLLKQLILENIEFFMQELGNNFSFIKSEYKIKIGDRYNYIDILLFNIKHNCYVIIELKVTELKKDHIGQIHTYMSYIDTNLKTIYHNNTIGIIICKKDNKFIMEYCSDERILSREYQLI